MLHLLTGLLFCGALCLAASIIVRMISAERVRIAAVLSGAELAIAAAETRRIRVRIRERRREFAPARPVPLRAAA